MNTPATKFEDTPLITPERITADPHEAFRTVPKWIVAWALTAPDNEETRSYDSVSPGIAMVIGKKFRLSLSLSPAQLAVLCEMGRFEFGHGAVTNSNHRKPPTIYARFRFRDAPEDLTSINRIFQNAIQHEAVKQGGMKSDLRAENLYSVPEGKPEKNARHVAMGHVERLAREREAGGTLPKGLVIAEYLANIRRLLAIIDLEAAGHDPLATAA